MKRARDRIRQTAAQLCARVDVLFQHELHESRDHERRPDSHAEGDDIAERDADRPQRQLGSQCCFAGVHDALAYGKAVEQKHAPQHERACAHNEPKPPQQQVAVPLHHAKQHERPHRQRECDEPLYDHGQRKQDQPVVRAAHDRIAKQIG